ncbi:MAG TPA: tetratricopeptide repeat protein [Stellaceae bacterium]|nr:tetratricopeptide repeat protein [Stellaceae bacterium]
MNRKERRASGEAAARARPVSLVPGVRPLLVEAARHAQAGRPADAALLYSRAIDLDPTVAGAHVNLALAFKAMGRRAEALAACQRAIAVEPGLAEAHYNLGLLLRDLERLEEAAQAYREAIALKPSLVAAHCNLGNVLKLLARREEAAACYRAGLVHAPNDPELNYNLASVIEDRAGPEEQIALYRRALAAKPDFAAALGNLAFARLRACDWDGIEADLSRCRAFVAAGVAAADPFAFLSMGSRPDEQQRCARLEAAAARAAAQPLPPPAPRQRDRLRLGYMSADLREHAVATLTAELFERHDRARFEVAAYSIGPDDASPLRRRLERAFDRFVDLRALSNPAAAQRIREDGIDILVDLTGYTQHGRAAVLAARPAPVQVNFLGFIGTMGADFIDYVLADATALPFEQQEFFDEKIVHLPDCFMPGDTRREVDARIPTRAECGLPERGFVFCCFNNSYKLTPEIFAIWMRILAAVPDSVLWLIATNAAMTRNLRREAARHGVAPERLVFAPYQPQPQHLARHRLADLFLDTLPRNAHTTGHLALWMGLPVLTRAAGTFNGNTGASLLRTVGLPELVTRSAEEYEALAVRLATEPALLGGLRQRLERQGRASPLFDMARYTRGLEAAFERMWEIWSAGRPPESFAVPG